MSGMRLRLIRGRFREPTRRRQSATTHVSPEASITRARQGEMPKTVATGVPSCGVLPAVRFSFPENPSPSASVASSLAELVKTTGKEQTK